VSVMPIAENPSSRPQPRMSRASGARSEACSGGAGFTVNEGEEPIIIGALRRYLGDAEATTGAGAVLAPGLRGGMIVTLSGELGSGKTTLVRGMLRALGWRGTVKSPSFALVEHYRLSSLYFYHFDFYRLDGQTAAAEAWDSTGFAEYFRSDAVAVIEWPERVTARLPQVDLAVRLEYAEPGRTLELRANTPAGDACLDRFAIASAGGP
jgi:tRNA threonylcarbamoyladenosine biosynthesis protein TsaE